MTTYAIIDFETTGLSPDQGACATEVGIVLVRDGQITDRYQSLMNGGIRLSSFIEEYTGITNAMVRKAPPLKQVMAEACEFARDYPLVAHNASFDRKFWDDGFLPTKVPKVPQGSAMQICSENPDIGIRAAGVSVLGFRMKNIQ